MDSLSLQLWGENSDQLPDAGYAAYRDGFSSWHKYFLCTLPLFDNERQCGSAAAVKSRKKR